MSATTENFAQQMEYVAQHFNVIKLETLVAYMTRGEADELWEHAGIAPGA